MPKKKSKNKTYGVNFGTTLFIVQHIVIVIVHITQISLKSNKISSPNHLEHFGKHVFKPYAGIIHLISSQHTSDDG